MKSNIHDFPYARSHHYFYDLHELQRIDDTSYVEDPNWTTDDPLQRQTYNDRQLMEQFQSRGFDAENIINRRYMGLPPNILKAGESTHGDKNPCHSFLFAN